MIIMFTSRLLCALTVCFPLRQANSADTSDTTVVSTDVCWSLSVCLLDYLQQLAHIPQ